MLWEHFTGRPEGQGSQGGFFLRKLKLKLEGSTYISACSMDAVFIGF